MLIPSFKILANSTKDNGYRTMSFATFIHPNPYFYKYYWWVFWQGSPCDGRKFLSDRYRMTMKQAFELSHKLHEEHQSHWIYNRRMPRLDPANTPFDPEAKVWQGVEWAKPFDQDSDEEYQGFK